MERMITRELPDLLSGTLDLLILRTLVRGEMHGYGIAQHRARSCALTVAGRTRLAAERQEFDRPVVATQQVLAT
jgi:hypothetical protein